MRSRCNNPNVYSYANYGGRGISVCERWQGKNGFANFLADMGDPPSANLSIERIDNNGNYEPDNCTWDTPRQQRLNQRRMKGR